MDMSLFELITRENIYTLKPGEWIWDSKTIERPEHARSLNKKTVVEPIGFRQIDILDLKDFGTIFNNQPFMLTDLDHKFSRDPRSWVYWEDGRFYRFKKEVL